jgi:hypothetical protein
MLARRLLLALAAASFCLLLSSCGSGNSSMHATGPAPVFSSTPVTAAAQGSAYSYQVAATDPAGGTVTFSLTTSPTGAALNSNTVTWTPTASQSRNPNNFTVTATTSEGGTATQSWTVSPTGTVTVTSMVTDWTPSGSVTIPESQPVENALVPNADGSITVLQGTVVSPGVYNISNVPAGYYWLVLGINTTQLFNAFWTNTSNFDAGSNHAGSPTSITSSPETTTFNFSVSGLNTASAPDYVVFMTDSSVVPALPMQPPSGAQTLNALFATNYGPYNIVDWSQVNNAFLLQYDATSLGSLDLLTLGPEFTLSDLSLTNGATNTITETLQSSPQTSLNLSVQGSLWANLLNNAGPSAATPNVSWLSVATQPYVTGGTNAVVNFLNPNLYLAMPAQVPGLQTTSSWPIGTCAPGLVPPITTQPAITTDQNFGTLQYGDPFPTSWTRNQDFCQSASVMIPVGPPLTNFPFTFSDGESVAPSSSPIVPVVSQVQSPMLNGTSLFTEATVDSTTLTLSWSAPATGAPYAYSIVPWQIIPIQNGVEFASAGTFSTAQTSVTLPPLIPANYIFVVTAQVDATANIQTSPYRSTLPTGYADVVSAPITINSSATGPEIHGNADMVKRLSQPVAFRRAVAAQKH